MISRFRFAALLGIAALALQGLLLWAYYAPGPKHLMGDEIMYRRVAGELVHGGPGQMESLWPPLYPRFLAGVLAASGDSVPVLQIVQFLLLVLTAVLLGDIAVRIVGVPPPGLRGLAIAIPLLDPTTAAFAHYLWPEILHLSLLTIALWIAMARPERLGWLLVLGLVLGLALLTKSLLGPFLPFLLAPLAVAGPLHRGVLRLAAVIVTLGATVAPVVLANGRESGAYVIPGSARFNAWVGLRDNSRRQFVGEVVGDELAEWQRSAPDALTRDRILEKKIRAFVSRYGVLGIAGRQLSKQYFRLFDRESFLTDQLPGPLAKRLGGSAYRTKEGRLSVSIRALSQVSYVLSLVLLAAGLVLLSTRGRPWLLVLLGFFLYNIGVFFFAHAMTRYRIALVPVFSVYAAWTAASLPCWLGVRDGRTVRWPVPSKPLLVLAALACALALFLAFGGGFLGPFLEAWL